jgi:hypothetical protein
MVDGIYWPYFLDERAIVGWLKYHGTIKNNELPTVREP